MGKNKEIWKDIPDYEGYYQVSNMGNVKSLERMIIRKTGARQLTRSILLKPFRGRTSPYYQVQFSKNNFKCKFMVHRLVAKVFLPGWNPLLEVNHIDGNRFNNKTDNLEMCTWQMNIDHSIANNLKNDYGEKHTRAKLTNVEAAKIRNLHIWGIKQVDLAKMYHVSKQTICAIIHKKTYIR